MSLEAEVPPSRIPYLTLSTPPFPWPPTLHMCFAVYLVEWIRAITVRGDYLVNTTTVPPQMTAYELRRSFHKRCSAQRVEWIIVSTTSTDTTNGEL